MTLPFSNPRHEAKRRISKAANAGLLGAVQGLVPTLEREVTRTVDGFFRSVVQYLGKEQSLAEQQPTAGLGIWQPLSLDYVKRKGHALFFLYAGRPLPPRSAHDILHGTSPALAWGGAPLIAALGRLSGTVAFGKTRITVLDRQDQPVTPGSTSAPPDDPSQVHCTTLIRPYGDLKRIDIPHLEHWLEHRGVISYATRVKLTNPNGRQRAFLRPLLARYSDVVLPSIIQAILRDSLHDASVTVRIKHPFDAGPF